VTNASLIKIDKVSFDSYVRDIFDNMLKDQLDFMKICPIFKGIKKETLIELGIRTERKKFITNSEILPRKFKADTLYIIRRGVVKVLNLLK
jgi:signal-transduction protein with cAMP-binding, CBS, and nucleotidyltransferase domain